MEIYYIQKGINFTYKQKVIYDAFFTPKFKSKTIYVQTVSKII
jgi:hypothetical protein